MDGAVVEGNIGVCICMSGCVGWWWYYSGGSRRLKPPTPSSVIINYYLVCVRYYILKKGESVGNGVK